MNLHSLQPSILETRTRIWHFLNERVWANAFEMQVQGVNIADRRKADPDAPFVQITDGQWRDFTKEAKRIGFRE